MIKEVERALDWADIVQGSELIAVANHAKVLAAEVRTLRSEVETMREVVDQSREIVALYFATKDTGDYRTDMRWAKRIFALENVLARLNDRDGKEGL